MKRVKLLCGFAASLCVLINSSQANLVIDGGFEIPVASGVFQTFVPGAMGAWTVTPVSVDLIGTYWQPSEGRQSLDLSGNGSGGVYQSVPTIPGVTYRLTFDMSGNPDGGFNPNPKTLLASLGASSQTFSYTLTGGAGGNTKANMLWLSMSVDFIAGAGTSSVLSFKDTGGTAYGAAIDNVSLVAVPEPTTLIAGALLLLPFAGSTIRYFRRNRTA